MEVIQSWEDDKGRIYAIVKHSPGDQQKKGVKEYEAMYLMAGELQSIGGSGDIT